MNLRAKQVFFQLLLTTTTSTATEKLSVKPRALHKPQNAPEVCEDPTAGCSHADPRRHEIQRLGTGTCWRAAKSDLQSAGCEAASTGRHGGRLLS